MFPLLFLLFLYFLSISVSINLDHIVRPVWCDDPPTFTQPSHKTHTQLPNQLRRIFHRLFFVCLFVYDCVLSFDATKTTTTKHPHNTESTTIPTKCAASFPFARHWTTIRCPPPGGHQSVVTKVCWSELTSMAAKTIGRYATIRCCAFSVIWDPTRIRRADAVASCKYICETPAVKCVVWLCEWESSYERACNL